jgi:hypothetical protein
MICVNAYMMHEQGGKRRIDGAAPGVTRVSSLSLSFFLDFLYAKPHLLAGD